MDFYSFLIPRPSYINSLPEMYFLFLPFNIIVYILIFLIIIVFLVRTEIKFAKVILLGGWFVLSLLYLIQSSIQVYTEKSLFGGKKLDELREITTSNNFYSYLQLALKSVPGREPVTLFLPENIDYFKQKAPYYIYPHPINNEASYFLVFNSKKINFDKNKLSIEVAGKESYSIEQVKLLSEYKPGMYVFKKE